MTDNIAIESETRPQRVRFARLRNSPLFRSMNGEGTLGLLGLLVLWQVASHHFSPMFFPSLQRIWRAAVDLLNSNGTLATIELSAARIFGALILSFILGSLLGVGASVYRRLERFLAPLIELKQGVPAVCWIIFATLWFREMEVRIAFVVVITALPIFYYQARDGVRAIPAELWGMISALRPNPWQRLRILVIPSMAPSMITAWRINVGNGVRVTIMAELLSGTSGIGYQLRLSQEMFRMDQVIVWTFALIVFVVVGNLILSAIERRLLKWRPKNETGHV